MFGLATNLPASQQWILVGYYLILGSALPSLGLLVFFRFDRWLVCRRGIPGNAVVEAVRQIQTLPRSLWEVRLEVTPDDSSTLPFRRRAVWAEADFRAQLRELTPGARLYVRFRRAPRPVVLPAARPRHL